MQVVALVADDEQAARLSAMGATRIDGPVFDPWPRLAIMDQTMADAYLDDLRSRASTRRIPVIVLGRHAGANACIDDDAEALASALRFWGEFNLPPRPE